VIYLFLINSLNDIVVTFPPVFLDDSNLNIPSSEECGFPPYTTLEEDPFLHRQWVLMEVIGTWDAKFTMLSEMIDRLILT
jgi:hypothetical protein